MTIDDHKDDARASQIAHVIAEIGNVDNLTANELVSISRRLYELVSFCDCIRTETVETEKNGKIGEKADHPCHKFHHHDHKHLPYCKCCQTCAFIYYFAWCLRRLFEEDKYSEFNNARLSKARIIERGYGYRRSESKIYFRIWRHPYAWTGSRSTETVLREWVD